jgi:hypothetical protein
MTEPAPVKRRRQFCTRCGQLMFEYYSARDGHFGVVNDLGSWVSVERKVMHCRTCGACYRWLDRLGFQGQPVTRV